MKYMKTQDDLPISVFTDGGARGNPGPSSIGFVVKKGTQTIHKEGKCIGVGTNNQAEYQAVIEALNWLIQNTKLVTTKKAPILFYLDSMLVVNQINGKFKIKNDILHKLILKIRFLEHSLGSSTSYYHVPREKNTEADALVNEALDETHV